MGKALPEEELQKIGQNMVEALDRVDVARQFIEYSLSGHVLIDSEPEFQKKVNNADQALNELYQLIAQYKL